MKKSELIQLIREEILRESDYNPTVQKNAPKDIQLDQKLLDDYHMALEHSSNPDNAAIAKQLKPKVNAVISKYTTNPPAGSKLTFEMGRNIIIWADLKQYAVLWKELDAIWSNGNFDVHKSQIRYLITKLAILEDIMDMKTYKSISAPAKAFAEKYTNRGPLFNKLNIGSGRSF